MNFESTVDDDGVHTPNLVVIQKVCSILQRQKNGREKQMFRVWSQM